jgi:hypothetical protein
MTCPAGKVFGIFSDMYTFLEINVYQVEFIGSSHRISAMAFDTTTDFFHQGFFRMREFFKIIGVTTGALEFSMI